MNIIEKIKNYWKNRNIYSLPKGKEKPNRQTKGDKSDRSWILPNKKSNGKTTKLEEEIEMFLQAYYQKLEEFDDLNEIDNDNIAYISLITLRGKLVTQDEFYKNYCSEQKLLKNLKKTDDYNIETQRRKNNCIDFYHIRTKNYKKPRDEDTIRIYINCNNGNVLELSRAILLYNNNPNLHLKFISSQQNYKLPRNEKIVIYCHKDELKDTILLLEHIKEMNPELFMEYPNTLPFLQSVNEIASISKQPTTNQYVNLNKKTKTINQSTNSFLTKILQESYIGTVREIARVDEKLSYLLDNPNINNETLYIKEYPYINTYYHDYLLRSMQAKMQVLSKRNNLYIDGLCKDNTLNRNNKVEVEK